jgi:transcription antitermination protein NusB
MFLHKWNSMARKQARELAFRTLFQAERGQMPLLDVWQQVREDLAETIDDEDELKADAETLEFADRLIKSFSRHSETIDRELQGFIEGWTFQQMAQTDLNVLRLAYTELNYEQGIPEVTLEMAVRLSKKYGGEESGRFVNGVLAKVLKALPIPS